MRTALITGITGQDGAYLSQFLLRQGYRVVGLLRRSASSDVIGDAAAWLNVIDDMELVDGDIIDLSSMIRVMERTRPEEVYNLAAQSFVATSWQQPLLTGTVTGLGAAKCWKRCASSSPRRASTRHPPPRCSAWSQEPRQIGAHAILPAPSLRRGKAVCPLDDGQLSRKFRPARLLRHSVQS